MYSKCSFPDKSPYGEEGGPPILFILYLIGFSLVIGSAIIQTHGLPMWMILLSPPAAAAALAVIWGATFLIIPLIPYLMVLILQILYHTFRLPYTLYELLFRRGRASGDPHASEAEN